MDNDTPAQVQVDAPTQVDTAPAPTIEADVQAIETPEAAVAQEATVNATDTVEEKLYAGKYKSIEDLESAYKNAESKLGSVTSQKAELSRILADAFAADPVAQVAEPVYNEYEEEPTAPASNDVYGRKIAVMEFSMSHPDADGEAMMEVIKNDPAAQRIADYDAKLKYAYAMSQISAKPKAVEEAVRQAQAQTQTKIAEKQAAQVESASKQSPPTTEEPLTKEQLRSMLKDDKSFNDILKKRPGFQNYVS